MKDTEANEKNIICLFLKCEHSQTILGEFCGNCGLINQQENVNIKIKLLGMH
jgi:hypothetical protein